MTTMLCLNEYTPNFDDPRTAKRVLAVLEWCDEMLIRKKPRSVNHATLRKVFGNTSQSLGKWLRSNLLMQMGTYAPGSHSYSYCLNLTGYEKLRTALGKEPRTSVDAALALYGPIVRGEVALEYADKNGRRYHPIQNIRREDRRAVFAGWWDYDIVSCAPTLVYQYAATHHLKANPENDDPFPAVAQLVREKDEVRQRIASLLGSSVVEAKEVLQGIFFQAPMAPHPRCSLFRLVGEDRARLEMLKQDEFIKALVRDVKKMWRYAVHADTYERASAAFAGKPYTPNHRTGARRRHAIYISLERKVMDAIQDAVGLGRFPGILMHDGFLSRLDIEPYSIQTYVEDVTGFAIKLKKEKLVGKDMRL